jgi:hypothetical protein
MISRRSLIGGSAILAGAAAVSGRAQAAGIPDAAIATSPAMQPPLFPSNGGPGFRRQRCRPDAALAKASGEFGRVRRGGLCLPRTAASCWLATAR